MSSLQFLFPFVGIPNKAAALSPSFKNRNAKINVHSTSRDVFQTSGISSNRLYAHLKYLLNSLSEQIEMVAAANMVDGTSTYVRDVRPPITSFRPSMWGDILATFSFDEQVQQKYSKEMEDLIKEARGVLMDATSTKLMVLIDTIERLGLAYHFESEIDEKLKQVFNSDEDDDYDLFTTALRFRLLRQHRYHVSCDGYNKFVDKDNKLKESICGDIEGLLSLYEAAHVRIHDENILDEAAAFTSHQLSNILAELEPPMREKVHQALDYPLHKTPTYLSLRFHISIYEKDESRDELLLRLAKLNFNFLQNIYRSELFQLSTWWNKFDLKSKLPYMRDRLVECYIWSTAYHFEPQYSFVRMMVAKIYQMLTAMDDTYDNYATLEESELLTQAFERWNTDKIDVLPDYMKLIYKLVMSVSEDFEHEAEMKEKSFAVPYFIEGMKQISRAYLQEQKWIMEREMPNFEDYMIHSRATSLLHVSLTAALPGIKSSTKETIDWLRSEPNIFVSANELGRTMEDLASNQRRKNGYNLDCYMKNKGVSKQEAFSTYSELMEDRWKQLNADWVKSRTTTTVPKEIVEQIFHLIQACEVFYKNNEDGYSYPEKNMTPLVVALLVEPLLI